MKVNKITTPGRPYKVCGHTAVFLDEGRKVTATTAAAIVYTDTEGRYSVATAKWNYVRGQDVKKWTITKGRSGLTWERAVEVYNEMNKWYANRHGAV